MKPNPVAAAVKQAFPPAAAPAAPAAPPPVTNNPDLIAPRPTPELNPRNKAMAEIAARANAQADVDAAETVPVTDDDGNEVKPAPAQAEEPEPAPATEEPPEAPAAAPAPEVPPEVAPAPQAAPAALQPVVEGIDPNAEYELMVEGKPMKFKGSQIVDAGKRAIQKETAADYRLKLATETLEEAKRVAAQLQTPPAKPAAAETPPLDEAALAEMIQFGTKEQAAEAVKVLRAQRPDTVSMDGLQKFVSQHLPAVVDAQLVFREAANYAKTEFGDLLTDPYLSQLWYMKEDQMRKAGDVRPYRDLYKAIGDDLRAHFNRPKPTTGLSPAPVTAAPTQPAAPTLAQRQAAKAAAPAAPRLAAARMEGGADAAKPKTREEIIDQMRKTRGQDTLTRR